MSLADLVELSDEPSNLDEALLDHVHVGVCVTREQRFLYVNHQLAHMLGYEVAAMIGGMRSLDIVHPEDRDRVLGTVERRRAGEAMPPYDVRLVGAGGRELHARVCGRPIRYRGAAANLVTMTDISEVKHALHEADWRARMLTLTEDLCGGASLAIDLHRDSVTASAGWWALLRMMGSAAAVGRRAVLSRIPRADRRTVVATWRNAVPGQPFELQHHLLCADGRMRVVHQRGLIEFDTGNGPPRGIAILQDITAQRDAERRLHELPNLDPLTDLPNRSGLIERMAQLAVQEGDAEGTAFLLAIGIPQLIQVKQGLGF